jgi:hypothetical protein
MQETPRLETLRVWHAEARHDLERAQSELARVQHRIEEARQRVVLLEQLLALERQEPTSNEARQSGADGFLDACENIIRAAGKPLHIKELQAALQQKGVILPGRGTDANLIIRLQRSDGQFVRTGKGTYGLPEFGLPQVKPARRRRVVRRG